jgi:hypothetical protein
VFKDEQLLIDFKILKCLFSFVFLFHLKNGAKINSKKCFFVLCRGGKASFSKWLSVFMICHFYSFNFCTVWCPYVGKNQAFFREIRCGFNYDQ